MPKPTKQIPLSPPSRPAPPSKSKPAASSSSATDLADEFDDLHFFPPSRSTPPSMKNFILSASGSNSGSTSGSGSTEIGDGVGSDDFTLGSRVSQGGYNSQAGGYSIQSSHSHHSHTGHGHTGHSHHGHNSRRSSHPSISRNTNSKERYVFSKFLVKEGSSLPKSVDESIDWLAIEMVLVPEIENVLCPICLDVPFIPRFTRCGHIYCLPCLLQFFQTSEASTGLGNNWRACPVCAEALHLKQLRPVKFCPATEPQEGEIFHSVFIKKPVGSLLPQIPVFQNDSLNSLSPFQRLISVNRTFVFDEILNPELSSLRSEIKNRKLIGEDSLELSFYESAIKHIEDVKTLNDSTQKTREQQSPQSQLSHKSHLSQRSKTREQQSKAHEQQTNEFYFYHQSRDGLNVFLHPLCMKILKYEFESYESIPRDLSLPIIQLERVIVNSSNRKRFKYLDHLSLGTQIILVEVDLKSIVSPETLQIHQKELNSRQGLRDQKLTRDIEPRDKSILEEWKMMEDDYYSITQATAAMNIKVPESVKLDNLDDEASFPLPSSFNNSSNSIRTFIPQQQQRKQNNESSPSFSALAHSWNSPFTFNSTYSGEGTSVTPPTVWTSSAWNTTSNSTTTTAASAAVNEESPTLSTLSTSSTGTVSYVGNQLQSSQLTGQLQQLPVGSVLEEELNEKGAMFRDFLTSRDVWGGEREYTSLIREMLKSHKSRLIVNVNDVRQFNRELANLLLQQPIDYLPTFEKALKEVIQELNEPIFGFDIQGVRFHIGLEGSFGELHTNPRHLSSRLLSHMVCLDGIVTSCSLVRPKLLKSVHYSESMKTFLVKEYWDATMLNGMQLPGSTSYPTEGDDKQKLTSEFGLSQYRDYQTISIQEMPEKAPAGQLPRSIDVIVDDDLVDKVKPGDRAQIVGVYKSLATAYNGQVPSTFRAVLVANNVRQLNRDAVAPQLSAADIQQIRSLSRRSDIFELISRSLAPSIYGHEYVKKAVALMLLGGVERNISNSNTKNDSETSEGLSTSTHIRGDINLMLVGDPSTAKSQMLRFVLGIAPLAIATTGRGSSGVGLTAAVTSDKETGERRLEAGAMVLADRGIVCIDEFDKMSDNDRVAIHEVMEQQTVTIAKAGIHASLNARCSVLAAANPIWGQYRETASPQENIRLPDSLLSRFDLLFIILDKNTPEHDRHISHHVLKMHRYIPPGLPEGAPIPENVLFDSEDEDEAGDESNSSATAGTDSASIFQRRYNAQQQEEDSEEMDEADQQLLTIQFIKKYLHYARTSCKPVLTKAAADLIVSAYSEFRQKKVQDEMAATSTDGGIVTSTAKTFPVTPRTLETLIRLATAHAKSRLSNKVEKKDARVAQEMIEFCLYQEVKKKPSKRTKKVVEESEAEESDESSDEEFEGIESDEDSKETISNVKPKSTIKTSKSTKTKSTSTPASIPHEKDIWDPELEEIATKLSQASSSAANRKKFYNSPTEDFSMSEVSQELPVAPQENSQPASSSLPVLSVDSQSQTPPLSQEEHARLRDHIHSTLSRLNQQGETCIDFDSFLTELKKSEPSIMVVAQIADVNEVLREMAEENKIYISEESAIYII